MSTRGELNGGGKGTNLGAMKRNLSRAGLLALASSLIGLGVRAGTPQPLPTPFPEARYQQMTARSPFAVASADAAAKAAPTPGFAAQLYVAGVAHVGTTDYVAIKTRSPEEGKPPVVLLEAGKPNPDGLKVERVVWSDVMGKSTVDVSKGGETATLAFDEAAIKSPPPVAPEAPAGPPRFYPRGWPRVPVKMVRGQVIAQ